MIRIQSLTKRYGDFLAVDSIDLHVPAGQIFGFLGPNGAGKTTTIRILAGLSLPTSGSATIGGFDVVRESRQAKKITGYIPDRPFLYEKLSGFEFLQLVADLYEQPWAECRLRADKLLDYLDLAEWVTSRIENFSHGMKQKLVIIAALVHDPLVLIIDEPMVGLDALAQRQVRKLLRTKADEGKAVLLTTHTLSVAEAICDQIAILHKGRIAASGTTDSLQKEAGEDATLEDLFLRVTFTRDPEDQDLQP